MSTPIQRTKLYEDVADRILERVRAGTWPAGSRLPAEGELAEEFDVSRSTVRAAVRSLRIAGVLQPRNGSGTYVTAQAQMILDTRELAAVMGDPARIRDLVETRYVLEPQVAALAALRASEAEKSALLADVARMEEKQDRPSLMALGYAFHQRLAQLCCNPVLAGFYQSAAGQLRCMRVLESLTLEVYLGDIAEHRRIAEAVAAGDAALAAERMREHLRRDYGAYLTELTALRQ